jgi:hypothetical protein
MIFPDFGPISGNFPRLLPFPAIWAKFALCFHFPLNLKPGSFVRELLRMVKTASEKVFSDLLDRRTASGTPSSQILPSSFSEAVFPHPRHTPS